MSVIDSVKSHPKLFGGVAIGAILLIVVLRMGSSQTVASAGSGQDASAVDSANQLQGLLASVQGQIAMAGVAAQAQKDHDAASIEALNIQANTTNAANTLAAQIASLQITKEAETTQQANSLAAHVAETNSNNQANIANINANQSIQTTRAFVDGMVSIANANASGAVGVAQASRPCSSYLFGLISSC